MKYEILSSVKGATVEWHRVMYAHGEEGHVVKNLTTKEEYHFTKEEMIKAVDKFVGLGNKK